MHRQNCLLSGQRVHPIVMPHLKVQKWHSKECLWLFELSSNKIHGSWMILVRPSELCELHMIIENHRYVFCQEPTLCQRDCCNAPWLRHGLGQAKAPRKCLKLPSLRWGNGNFTLRVLQEDHGHHRGSRIDFTSLDWHISPNIDRNSYHNELNWGSEGRENWTCWSSDFLWVSFGVSFSTSFIIK